MILQDNVLISVIIPIYKVEKYLKKCVESIVKQTYKNLEIILVDDGSPDSSGEICDELALIDSRITVVHKKNEGVSNARNTGIDISKGEYIYFIDGDDYAELNAIEVLLKYALEKNADIVVADTNIVNEKGNVLNDSNVTEIKYQEFSAKEAAEFYMLQDWGPWNKLYKRKVHEDVKFPSHKIHEDEAIMLQLISKSESIIHVHDKLYNYVKREGSTTTSLYSVKKIDWFEAWVNNVKYSEENFPASIDKAIYKMLITAIYNIDNLLKMESASKQVERIVGELKIYYKQILLNLFIPFTYKVRVILLFTNLKLYRLIYKNR